MMRVTNKENKMSLGPMARCLALAAALALLCNQTLEANSTGAQAARLLADEEQQLALVGARQLDFSPAAQELFSSGQARQAAGERLRRQVSVPQGSPWAAPEQAPAAAPGQGAGSSVLGFLSELGPQVAQAKAISSLFSSGSQQQQPPAPQQQYQQQPAQAGQSPVSSAMNAAALMGQLSELIRSTQDGQARALEVSRQTLQPVQSASQNAAQSAQGGIQAALADIGAGLQRIAANNPNLLPDVKSLYQSVSSKLSSASSSVAQATSGPSGQSQFAQGVANQIAQPQPLPAPLS